MQHADVWTVFYDDLESWPQKVGGWGVAAISRGQVRGKNTLKWELLWFKLLFDVKHAYINKKNCMTTSDIPQNFRGGG